MLAASKKIKRPLQQQGGRPRGPSIASAATLLKLSKPGNVTVHQAMKLVGYDTPLAKDRTLQKRVYRQRDQLATPNVLGAKNPPMIQQVVVVQPEYQQDSGDPKLAQMKKLKEDIKQANMVNFLSYAHVTPLVQ